MSHVHFRGLDFAPPETERRLRDDTPVVVVTHGLTGGTYSPLHGSEGLYLAISSGSHESYVRAVLAPVCRPREEGGLGYRAIVVNFRGCEHFDVIVTIYVNSSIQVRVSQ